MKLEEKEKNIIGNLVNQIAKYGIPSLEKCLKLLVRSYKMIYTPK
jgi:hypothetical protein